MLGQFVLSKTWTQNVKLNKKAMKPWNAHPSSSLFLVVQSLLFATYSSQS